MNFFFNLDVDSRIDYGLFPFVPYDSVPFDPNPINVDQSLLAFGFDLDPESNEMTAPYVFFYPSQAKVDSYIQDMVDFGWTTRPGKIVLCR